MENWIHQLQRIPAWVGALLLCLGFFTLSTVAVHDNSPTIDELSHIPSGYYYLQTGRYLINPEHPPLVKDIAALPLLAMDLTFTLPTELEYANGQWDLGRLFLYGSGNDAQSILFWSHIAVLLVNTALLFLLWWLLSRVWSTRAAFIGLFLLASSPLLLSHGTFITMDVMTSLFQVVAMAATALLVQRFVGHQSTRVAGVWLVVGVTGALLSKFSALLIVPTILVAALLYIAQHVSENKRFLAFLKLVLLYAVISIGIVIVYYMAHVWNMSSSDVLLQIEQNYREELPGWGKSVLEWCANASLVTRAIAEYAIGTIMVSTRLNEAYQVTYFLGHVYENVSVGWNYFPVLFMTKQSLALLALFAFSMIWMIVHRIRQGIDVRHLIERWTTQPLSFMIWWYMILYTILTFDSTLQIGVRHIMPIIVMATVLVARGIDQWWEVTLFRQVRASAVFWGAAVSLCVTLVITFPYYLSYYHVLAGGVDHGYEIATDSNYDWGQDLKRLGEWTRENNVTELYMDLFTSSDVSYYVGPIGQGYSIGNGWIPPAGSYIAVSVFQYQNFKYMDLPEEKKYTQLDPYRIARIGTSIFIYQVPPDVGGVTSTEE